MKKSIIIGVLALTTVFTLTIVSALADTVTDIYAENINPRILGIDTVSNAHAAGVNVRDQRGTIYFITPEGEKRPYPSIISFISYRGNRWDQVKLANAADLALPTGSAMEINDGTTVFDPRTRTVYVIKDGQRHGFTSAKVFTELGHNFSNVVRADTSGIPTGENIAAPDTKFSSRQLDTTPLQRYNGTAPGDSTKNVIDPNVPVANRTRTGSPALPSIIFTATPENITAGSYSGLSWSATNSTSCVFSNSSSTQSTAYGILGGMSVNPTRTTSYYLVCKGDSGQASATVRVTVAPATPAVTCTIDFFTVPPMSLGSPTPTVAWATSNCTSATLSQNTVGEYNPAKRVKLNSDSTIVSANTTYTLIAQPGNIFATLPVPAATPAVAAPTVIFTASPENISAGSYSSLSWTSTNASSCVLSNSGGGQGVTYGTFGGMNVNPTQTTTYTVVCTGPGGSATRSVVVSVTGTTPPGQPANPTQYPPGVTLLTQYSGLSLTRNLIIKFGRVEPVMSVVGYRSANLQPISGTQAFSSNYGPWKQLARPYVVRSPIVNDSPFTFNDNNLAGYNIEQGVGANDPSLPSWKNNFTWPKWTDDAGGNGPANSNVNSLITIANINADEQALQALINAEGWGVPPAPGWATPVAPLSAITIGGRIQLTANTNVRTSGNMGSPAVGTQPSGSTGVIIGGALMDSLGVWWNVDYDTGPDGWSIETYMVPSTGSSGSTPPPSGTLPITLSFSASPSTITAGSYSGITWTSTNASSCVLSNSGGGQGVTYGTFGGMNINPTQTTTYTLVCKGTAGQVTKTVTVTVNPATVGTVCKIDSFTGSPTTIAQASSSTLSWTTSGCANAALTNGRFFQSPQPLSGSDTTGIITGSTYYVLSANNAQDGTSDSKSLLITVDLNVPAAAVNTCKVTLSAFPSTININESSQISWTTSCTYQYLNGGGYSNASMGQFGRIDVSPSQTTTYSMNGILNPIGGGASTVDSKTITITVNGSNGLATPAGSTTGSFDGYVESITPTQISGWAYDNGLPISIILTYRDNNDFTKTYTITGKADAIRADVNAALSAKYGSITVPTGFTIKTDLGSVFAHGTNVTASALLYNGHGFKIIDPPSRTFVY